MDARPYTVHIYEDEASLISKWTLQYPNLETGGDIFGLWLNENEVVIQAVLGPGRNCRRTATSFFQDEQYLSHVGVLLTLSQGLCNVGSWHSHHMMNLPDPSRGDKDTIWRHLPTPGRFLLLIATIEMKTGAPKVQMGFNLFESTSEGNKVIPMKLEILQGQSPIRANKAINHQMLEGAEVTADLHVKKDPEQPVQLDIPRQEINKTSRSESNAGHDITEAFFKNKKSRPEGGQHKPMPQNLTCDGVHSHDTFPIGRSEVSFQLRHRRSAKREERSYTSSIILLPDGREKVVWYHYGHSLDHGHEKQRLYTFSVVPLSNGREKMIWYHCDHLLGECKDCSNTKVRQTEPGGRMYVDHENCIIQ